MLTIPDNAEKGYLIDVSQRYPDYLHDDHNCFPLAPEKRMIKNEELSPYAKHAWEKLRGKSKRPKTEKLLCTLGPKPHYILHYVSV